MVDRRYVLDGTDPRYDCKCVTKHVPKPLELHRHYVWPLDDGGPEVKSNSVTLCPTTDVNVHKLWRLYEENNGRPPWGMLRNYSEYCRAIVEKGRYLRSIAEVEGKRVTHFPQEKTSPDDDEDYNSLSVIG